MDKERGSGFFLKLILFFLGAAILITGGLLAYYAKGYMEDRKNYDRIRETAYGNGASSIGEEESSEGDSGSIIDFGALKKINPDTAGWLIAAGGEIDGPVVQATDDEYYLRHRFDGSESSAGAFFADTASAPAFKSSLTAVFGHNRKDGSMFHPLLKYKDPDYFADNPGFTVITEEGPREYRIASAFYSDYHDIPGVGDGETDPGRIYENAVNRSLYDTGAGNSGFDPATDRIVILCTCEYSGADNRMAVYGVIKE